MIEVKGSIRGLQVLSDQTILRERNPPVSVKSQSALEKLVPGSVVLIRTNETGSGDTLARYTGRRAHQDGDKLRFYYREKKEAVRILDVPISVIALKEGVLSFQGLFNTAGNFTPGYCCYNTASDVLEEVGL